MFSRWGAYCGMDAYSADLAEALGAQADVFVYANSDEVAPRLPEATARPWRSDTTDASASLSAMASSPPDVVHIQFNWGYMRPEFVNALVEGLRKAQIPVVLQVHRVVPGDSGWRVDQIRPAVSRADLVIVHSERDEQELTALCPRRTWLWRLGERNRELPPPREARQALGIPESARPLLTTFGFIQPRKGLLPLLSSIELLAARHPGVALIALSALHPRDIDLAHFMNVQDAAALPANSERVRVIDDYLSESAALLVLRASDLIVLPYTDSREGCSAAAKFAAQAGRPLLVSSEPIFDNMREYAATIATSDADAIAQRAGDLLADSDELTRLASCALAFSDLSAWPRIIDEFMFEVRSVVAAGGNA